MANARIHLIAYFAIVFPLGVVTSTAAEPITFAHKNWSDLRGILNVFDAFKQACLDQPVTRGLPEALLPEDYQIVSSGLHALGFDTGGEPKAVVLSKTGDEEKDFAEGEPFIELGFPADGTSNGECRVAWKRAWDYPDGLQKLIAGTGGVFDSWLSFQLKAVRVSRPDDMFGAGNAYSSVSEWAAPCLDSTWCRLSVLLTLTVDEGIYLTMKRGDPPTAAGSE
jgi:hypothetical protein